MTFHPSITFDHLVVGVWAGWAVLVTWELVEETNGQVAELRAAETANDWADVLVDEAGDWGQVVDGVVEEVGDTLLEKLEGEAGEVVASEEGAGVEDTARDVGDVQAGEGVDLAGVTTELEGVWVGEVANGDVTNDILGLVWSVRWATVL